ncbi:hypothetical protein Scep_026585 [Stephania cephalantha]|uniref:Uncharacterized protein n=1 Tax=Stephania cephalantha TaxID=152367 RepID=A0AAP0HSP4_9MAGN
MKFIRISSMPIDENITLKKNLKLKVELPQPKSQVENISSSCFKSQVVTSSCFKSNVIGKFANTTGGTCGHDSSLKDPNNNNILNVNLPLPRDLGIMQPIQKAKLQRRRQELTQTTPDQQVDDEAVYYKVAGECPKGRVYSLRSLGRKKRRYVDPDASTSQVLAQRGIVNFMILRDGFYSVSKIVDVDSIKNGNVFPFRLETD